MKLLLTGAILSMAAIAITLCAKEMVVDGDTDSATVSDVAQKSDCTIEEVLASLEGKPARVYQSGSMLTMDFNAERVNIELDDTGKIVKIWLG